MSLRFYWVLLTFLMFACSHTADRQIASLKPGVIESLKDSSKTSVEKSRSPSVANSIVVKGELKAEGKSGYSASVYCSFLIRKEIESTTIPVVQIWKIQKSADGTTYTSIKSELTLKQTKEDQFELSTEDTETVKEKNCATNFYLLSVLP